MSGFRQCIFDVLTPALSIHYHSVRTEALAIYLASIASQFEDSVASHLRTPCAIVARTGRSLAKSVSGERRSVNLQRPSRLWRLLIFCIASALLLGLPVPQEGTSQQQGQLSINLDFLSAYTYSDPAEAPAISMTDVTLDALHDILIEPLPDNARSPGLATTFVVSPDGRAIVFQPGQGLAFHCGDPLTAVDF